MSDSMSGGGPVRVEIEYSAYGIGGGYCITPQPKLADGECREYQLSDPATHTPVENGELERLRNAFALREIRAGRCTYHELDEAESGAGA